MVRIAGIEKEFTPLELMFIQAPENEKLEIAAGYLAQVASNVGDIEVKIELESNTKVIINAKVKKR